MGLYFPPYRRGQSQIGYTIGCSRNRRLMDAVPSPQDRIEICKDHLLEIRNTMRVFDTEQKKSK